MARAWWAFPSAHSWTCATCGHGINTHGQGYCADCHHECAGADKLHDALGPAVTAATAAFTKYANQRTRR
jgi:hypothetical protein